MLDSPSRLHGVSSCVQVSAPVLNKSVTDCQILNSSNLSLSIGLQISN
uniref:Uncharacterized protein n=1 Tax=Arundo donax TaxID=35708 RepID=A0A0A9GRK4_ARUDO